ncbi:MAG: pyruvate dehydrogenase complex dihydrolipoamide acetyltransferase [Rhodobacteraceae bacterium]|nr:pyruvate dehydrogenase complex dihydrolipoamide acetyltransferase [Paracoccaceae bacterium]MCY4140879.1 pyruvate dehydrogenase complex dihydrolipoamide acetyltransferase [Paracoccaceae bacterium]
MPIKLLMPALSPTMEAGTLAKWLVEEGDSVSAGDLLAEIETDKAVMEFEAVDEGTIARILVPEGTENVAVNSAIAILAEDDEQISDAVLDDITALRRSESDPDPQTSLRAGPGTDERARGDASAARDRPRTDTQPAAGEIGAGRIIASPLARKLAKARGIDLASVTGTGHHGRIIKRDIEGFTQQPDKVVAKPAAPDARARPAEPLGLAAREDMLAAYRDRPHNEFGLDGMKKTVAARLTEAKQTIPHFYLRRKVLIDRLLELRSDINSGLEHRGIRVSVNDFIIKACADSLQDMPECNAIWAGDRIVRFDASDVAVAVAVEGGLFTPVIRDCETMRLSAISETMKDLAERARDRKLAPEEYAGGSCTISNLGMFGVDSFDAVINPPHSFILAIGAGRRSPVITSDDSFATATVMEVTMSVDHRTIDGAVGARFLEVFTGYLENPATLLV